jgi:hypothetical protein
MRQRKSVRTDPILNHQRPPSQATLNLMDDVTGDPLFRLGRGMEDTLRYGVFQVGQFWSVTGDDGTSVGFPSRGRAMVAAFTMVEVPARSVETPNSLRRTKLVTWLWCCAARSDDLSHRLALRASVRECRPYPLEHPKQDKRAIRRQRPSSGCSRRNGNWPRMCLLKNSPLAKARVIAS